MLQLTFNLQGEKGGQSPGDLLAPAVATLDAAVWQHFSFVAAFQPCLKQHPMGQSKQQGLLPWPRQKEQTFCFAYTLTLTPNPNLKP